MTAYHQDMASAPPGTPAHVDDPHSAEAIQLGRPSYSWQFGQDRRLDMVRRFVPLEGARILDVGCGIGTYVRRFQAFSDEVHGVDVDRQRVEEASKELRNIRVAPAESLPYPDDFFDLVFLNEVIEHVDDDRATIAEACRVTRPGGRIVVFAPNRLFPFETHGAYLRGRYRFGNIPLVNWLPDPLRDRLAPHVRAYTERSVRRLFGGLPLTILHHRAIYPGFDKISARNRLLGGLLRRGLYLAETTPLHRFGLSHFLVARKQPHPGAEEARVTALDLATLQDWLDRYVAAWRSNDRGQIEALFTEDASYRTGPFDEAFIGRASIVDLWTSNPDQPGSFECSYHALAVTGDVGVAEGWTVYEATDAEPRREYSNIYVMRFEPDGRTCREFREWFMQRPAAVSDRG